MLVWHVKVIVNYDGLECTTSATEQILDAVIAIPNSFS